MRYLTDAKKHNNNSIVAKDANDSDNKMTKCWQRTRVQKKKKKKIDAKEE
jgi:hypothetical protein